MTALLLLSALTAQAGETVTVLHTNDWQSRLLGFGPNAEYTPDVVGDDDTVGGIARLATLIEQRRAAAKGPVVLVDGGDWTMGTLFHTVTRETGSELQLMSMLGYDGVTLGNHEFDFRPGGLDAMIRSAKRGHGAPVVLATNLVLDAADPRDDGLEALVREGAIQPTLLLERGGVKIGLLGLLGEEAYEVIGQGDPVSIRDPFASAEAAAADLRSQGADVVLLLSHSGIEKLDGVWQGPELDYAEQIPGIDAVIGGHSHTPLFEPLYGTSGVPVVQAGSEAAYLGELVLDVTDGKVTVTSYTLHEVNDTIPGDPEVQAYIEGVKEEVTSRVLSRWGLGFDDPLAETSRDLTRDFDDYILGNLVTDAIREATGAQLAFTGNGTIRDNVKKGRTGVQRTSDLFRLSGLGVGLVDDEPGYGLMVSYFTGADLKAVLEFLLVGYQLKGRKYYPRVSGIQAVYNNKRVLFDRIEEVRIGTDEGGYREVDLWGDELFSVATTTYIGGFLPTVGKSSKGILSATMRDASGEPVTDFRTLLVDADPSEPGTQELKAWRAVIQHLSAQPDTDGDGLADLPVTGGVAEARLIQRNSWSPSALLRNSTWRQRSAMSLPLGLLGLLGALGGLVLWWRRRSAGK